MIDIKTPEEEKTHNTYEQLEEQTGYKQLEKLLNPDLHYLKEISKTLDEILREMRKRKV